MPVPWRGGSVNLPQRRRREPRDFRVGHHASLCPTNNLAGVWKGERMVASDSFAEFLREQLAPMGRVTMRRMFGKTGVFCNGLMWGMVTDDTLYVRVYDHTRTVFKEAESER